MFSVSRKGSRFICPAGPTPAETLSLSTIDRTDGLRHSVRSLHVFKSRVKAVETIKEAVSKALVHYYPFAGRFTNEPASGELKVACTGEGVWFVEAVSNWSMEDVNFLDHPMMIPQDQLLPVIAPEVNINPSNLLLMMQVTEFACGGFVVGLISFHTIMDGLGAAQFLKSIGEIARGFAKPTVMPIWARELIPNPPKFPGAAGPQVFPSFKLQHTTVDFAEDSIRKLKSDFFLSTGQHCSSFDVSIAKTWQARTRAVGFGFGPKDIVHVCFFANTRHLLRLEEGFYGNCFYPVTVTSNAGTVAEASLVEVVRIIRDAKSCLPNELAKWAVGGLKKDPFMLTFSYNNLFVSDWRRLGFSEVDYGWGTPVNVIPFAYYDVMAVAIIGAPPVPKKGVRILTQCVQNEHLEAFKHEIKNFASLY